jgi:hypothetical protein
MATASGDVVAPVVTIPRLPCLGQHGNQCQALAHALPFGSSMNSGLGMDFFERFPLQFE